MSNIVIFGGSFDPIHNGHISIVKQIYSVLEDISHCYLIPSGEHPENKKFFFSAEERVLMIKACFDLLTHEERLMWDIQKVQEPLPLCEILDIELVSSEISYTINTIEYVKSINPKDRIHLLIGGDQAMKFSSWFQAEKISKLVTLWVYPRKDTILDSQFQWNILESELQDISSTYIRESILKKDSLQQEKIPYILQKLIPKILLARYS